MIPSLDAQPAGFNYDEAQVPAYTLPDPLRDLAGTPVASAATWQQHRRAEVLALFEENVYGRVPAGEVATRYELLEEDRQAFGGQATRQQVRVHFSRREQHLAMDILVYLPNATTDPAPIFLGLNFMGNHSVSEDPAILLNTNWMWGNTDKGVIDYRATPAARGVAQHRWPITTLLDRGYGLATIYVGDIDPDFDDGFQNGIHPLFYRDHQIQPKPDEWGTIGAWAWGLSRAVDYFETNPAIDATRVAVMGHSRLGKAALWAGATDERFALVISNESGCGGAALARRRFGETVQRVTTHFPHWFNGNHPQFSEREADLPVDQHMLIALIAPRPVYIASAEGDQWSDPNGEFLSGRHAEPVYALFGHAGLGVDHQPALHHPVGDFIGYHIRAGRHDVMDYDWAQYLNFADRHFGRSP